MTAQDNEAIAKIASFDSPIYINTTPVLSLGGVNFELWDVIKTALAARLNAGLAGEAGEGKSQLIADIKSLFGNNASYVLGRNDLDIKSLYREMNFKGLKDAMEQGGTVSQRDIARVTSEITRPLTVVEEINRCAEIVQNQLFNIFEGFIELNGIKYSLGGTQLQTFTDSDGSTWTQNVAYSVGLWSANFGNDKYTGTVSMDDALRQRSHLIIDVDNFGAGSVSPSDIDGILLGCKGEVRLKDQDKPDDMTKTFVDAFYYLKQKALTPEPLALAEELTLLRYLTLGLDYIPCEAAENSKRKMKEVWPSKAEEDSIGSDDSEIMRYRMIYPASKRIGLTIISFARALREYARAKDPKSNPSVFDSVIESLKLIAPYSGMLDNPQRIREKCVGNNYLAAKAAGETIKSRLKEDYSLIQAVQHCNIQGTPIPKNILDKCKGDYACFR